MRVVRVRVVDLFAVVLWVVGAGLAIGSSVDARSRPLFVWTLVCCMVAALVSMIAWESRRLARIEDAYALGKAARELQLVRERP